VTANENEKSSIKYDGIISSSCITFDYYN